MRTTIGMIVLNEAEYIERNLRQHYPLADRIVIVEGADQLYPRERVTADGLSTDATAEIVRSFPDPDGKIKFIQHGFAQRTGDQAKCELRNRYLDDILTGVLVVIDADEFYRRDDFAAMLSYMQQRPRVLAFSWPTVHFWRSDAQFITGGYYDLPHTRFWRIRRGDRYERNHNVPERSGRYLIEYRRARGFRSLERTASGYRATGRICYHYGFCKPPQHVADKNAYYLARGEGETRQKTTASRAAWFGDDANLPAGLRIWPYAGPLPESMSKESPPATAQK